MHTGTMSRKDEGRNQSDASISQGMPMLPANHQKQGEGTDQILPHSPQHLDLGLLAFKAMR